MDSKVTVNLGGREREVPRARLGLYLRLEIVLGQEREAASKGDGGAIADSLFKYLNLCIPELDRGEFNETAWYQVVESFAKVVALNAIRGDFALLRGYGRKGGPGVPWDHPDRARTVWIHMLAAAYKWSLGEIENLEVEEAVALIQEIEADEQQAKEFQHALSEVAYQYDKASKRSRYIPLKRPAWMVMRNIKSVVTKLRKDLLPVGRIITLDEQMGHEVKH